MKVTYNQLVNSVEALNQLAEKELPYRVASPICKNIEKIQEKVNDYYNELNKIYDECLEKDENGEFVPAYTEDGKTAGYKIQQDKVEECNDKIKELNNFSIEVAIKTIQEKDLDEIKISPNMIKLISFMIEE